jgi:hypothetical protein
MISNGKESDQPLYTRLWGSGFLPSEFQGVQFRGSGDPVLFLSNPPGIDARSRRRMLDGLAKLNNKQHETYQDPEIATRIQQYEMAFRMQTSVPELVELSKESEATLKLYGPDVKKPGSFAYNCLLARRMAERECAYQLYHRGWDQHSNLPKRIREQCLIPINPVPPGQDPKPAGCRMIPSCSGRRVWPHGLQPGKIEKDNYGRDHHGRNCRLDGRWRDQAGHQLR